MKIKRHNKSITFLFIVLSTIGVYSCGEDDMQLSYQHAIQAKAISMATKKDTVFNNLSVEALNAQNSVLYANVESTGVLFLVPNINSDETTFKITNNKSSDHITFYYTKKTEPISGSGGITLNLNITGVDFTKNYIDTVIIVKPGVNYNESDNNVEIYIKN